ARVEPKIVQLDQNRVDVVFEIYEGDLAKVRAINILGNTHFSDARLRKEMYTRQTGGLLGFLKSNDTYDPDRLAADQQKLRDFPNAKVLQVAKLTPGSWFNAKQVEDAVTNLNEAAGNLGYAFADINPA